MFISNLQRPVFIFRKEELHIEGYSIEKTWQFGPQNRHRNGIYFMLNAADSQGVPAALFYNDFGRMLPIRTNNIQGSKK